MFRNLLATTAIATLLATAAYAQEATPTPMARNQAAAEHLASNIIGKSVYNGAGADAKDIGKVTDMIIAPDGSVAAVVVGVGGFLGLGEKDVAVDYRALGWADRKGERWLVINATKEQLEAQPAFDRRAYDQTIAEAPAATDKTTTGAIDKSQLTKVPAGQISSDQLVGATVYGVNDANVGKIREVVLSTDGKVDAIIVDVGGFLGMGAKEVAVGMDNLAFMTDKDGNKYLYTEFTKDQLEAQPAYDKGTYAEQRDKQRLIMKQ